MIPFPTVQAAYDAALKALGPEAAAWAIPHGGSVLPVPRGEGPA